SSSRQPAVGRARALAIVALSVIGVAIGCSSTAPVSVVAGGVGPTLVTPTTGDALASEIYPSMGPTSTPSSLRNTTFPPDLTTTSGHDLPTIAPGGTSPFQRRAANGSTITARAVPAECGNALVVTVGPADGQFNAVIDPVHA